jgi:ABC-2 type transport system ATP-binding protein
MSPSDNTLAIDLHHVEKVYKGRIHALQGIAMQVNRGEVFGLLGPNGAGKSTLVKIMMTIVRPTRADGTLLGRRLGDKTAFARVGYLPENHRLPHYLTGAQALDYFAALSGVDRTTRRRRTAELLETVSMSDWGNKRVGTYSKGMQQRIGLAQALMNDPELIILDEPSDGVDPVGRRDIREVLRMLQNQGKTIFINSHLLSELEMVCQRVAILDHGKILKQGTIDELTDESLRYEIVIQAAPPGWFAEVARAQSQQLEDGRSQLKLPAAAAADVQPIIDRLRQDGIVIESVQHVRESLEDLFMRSVVDTEIVQAELIDRKRE